MALIPARLLFLACVSPPAATCCTLSLYRPFAFPALYYLSQFPSSFFVPVFICLFIMGALNTIVVSLLSVFAYASPLETISKRQSAVPYGTIITRCSVPGTFALTFDDGPFIYTDELLNLLASNGVKATFFVNGQNLASIFSFTSTIQRMVNDGHQVASHT
jgi:hypothetical protein